MNDLLRLTPDGIHCPEGDFTIDPRVPVRRAVITHAHADHARGGSTSYLCTPESRGILQHRLGHGTDIQCLAYGETLAINGIELSLHPAGHILGAAQVRLARKGFVAVVSGDYKVAPDPTCHPLEPQRCHHFVSESTFGLPIFRWSSPHRLMADIRDWWRENQAQRRTSVLFAYALGKAQRILAGLGEESGPILTHGAVASIDPIYRASGVALPETRPVGEVRDKTTLQQALVIAPPSADHPGWMRRFPRRSRAFASGWMRIRGNRRRRSMDRGFVLSDHADWEGLVTTITATGADRITLTHGYAAEMARWLREQGLQAEAHPLNYPGEGAAERIGE